MSQQFWYRLGNKIIVHFNFTFKTQGTKLPLYVVKSYNILFWKVIFFIKQVHPSIQLDYVISIVKTLYSSLKTFNESVIQHK